MRRNTVAIALVLAVVAGAPLGSLAESTNPVPVKTAAELRNNCTKLFTQKQFKKYASKVYTRERVTYTARARMVRMVRCQHSPKAERKMRGQRKQYVAARKQRQTIAALTPYGPCYGGMWAIPCPIVGCESGGSWGAYNPSGALGPYQLLGKGAPFPVRSLRDKIIHHLKAKGLWRGGAGSSHWSQCL